MSRADQGDAVAFSRAWAMPSRDTFSVPPMGAFVRRYLALSNASVDLFSRNNRWAMVTNDLDPATSADHHLDAEKFCRKMARQRRLFDLAIFDPPYSPRQISECYGGMGRKVSSKDTQNAALYRRVRDAMMPILAPGATVLSFGWNSNGMGSARGFEIIELVLVAHGGAHNDTICIAERMTSRPGSAGWLPASAIDAQSATTEGRGPQDESAARQGDAKTVQP